MGSLNRMQNFLPSAISNDSQIPGTRWGRVALELDTRLTFDVGHGLKEHTLLTGLECAVDVVGNDFVGPKEPPLLNGFSLSPVTRFSLRYQRRA